MTTKRSQVTGKYDDEWYQNFQRVIQSMILLLNWRVIDREEIRLNLPRMGMQLKTEKRELPPVPGAVIEPEAIDLTHLHDVPDDVMRFIEENEIPDYVLSEIDPEAFASVESLVRAINVMAESIEMGGNN
jgi:hypothetical protein